MLATSVPQEVGLKRRNVAWLTSAADDTEDNVQNMMDVPVSADVCLCVESCSHTQLLPL